MACPEICDIFDDGEYIGYYRIRNGSLRVENTDDFIVFSRYFPLDSSSRNELEPEELDAINKGVELYADGIFPYDMREVYRSIAVRKIQDYSI